MYLYGMVWYACIYKCRDNKRDDIIDYICVYYYIASFT